jgi:hypothetical protein
MAEKEIPNMAENETTNGGSLTNEEIDVLLENIDEKISQEEKRPSDPFNKIVKLDDRAIQKVIQKTDGKDLAKALKPAGLRVQNKIFRNMTKRAATMLKEDIEYMGPIRLKDVEEAQRKIFSTIYQLADKGEITIPEDFLSPDDLDQAYAAFSPLSNIDSEFKNIEEFTAFLAERRQPEELYGHFSSGHGISTYEITMCRFFESKNNKNILSDIEQKNEKQGMGNFKIPNTKMKLINYSICPKCGHIFSFKELIEYYANPHPDSAFKNRAEQYREDTRIFCHECGAYFLPALVIVDGTPKNEVQFLCRVQTTIAIERFYRDKGKGVLSTKKENVMKMELEGKTVRAIRNDVSLKQLSAKPTLISNLLQYTPANLVLNLIDGSNYQKGDVLFGAWQ